MNADYLVIGGGMLGSAIGYGLARQGLDCAILDGDDRDFRAARGNFGLVWVQSKGADLPDYARWTRDAAALWPTFAAELQQLTGIDVQYQPSGGLHYCLDEAELEARQLKLAKLAAASDGEFSYRMLDNAALRQLEPAVGPSIPGGSWSPCDAHVNPLYLLRALHTGFTASAGRYLGGNKVSSIKRGSDGYQVQTNQGEVHCQHVILCAGLDNARLAPMVGLQQPVFAQRGQILVTERLPKLLNYPSNCLRQTTEGAIQIGDSKELVGLDDGQSTEAMAKIAKRACRIIPELSQRRIVRGWGALRILTQDGYPVYEQNDNAWAFTSHSGVTLAPVHAIRLGEMLADKQFNETLDAFSTDRFRE